MLASAGAVPAFTRIEVGGASRALPDFPHRRPALVWDWGTVRAMQMEAEAQELPHGHMLNHVVTLNLGAETTSETNFDGLGWQTHRTPHHGINVYPALIPYETREHQPREYFLVELVPEFVAQVLEPVGIAAELHPVIGARDPFASHVILAMAEEARLGGEASALRAESLGTALVSHLAERSTGAQPVVITALSSLKLRRVLDYVTAHLDSPLTLRTLAGLVEMDVFRFMRAFKQSTGLSPHRYVLEARITRAKELLRNRSLSITEVALETGFATPSHFSVTFRRLVNATPREYRDSLP